MGTVLRWFERVLFVIAALCLAYVALTLSEAAYYRAAARALAMSPAPAVTGTRDGRSSGDTPFDPGGRTAPVRDAARADAPAAPAAVPRTPPADTLIGELEIPHLGIATAVLEGDDRAALRRGAGHLPGSALPGEPGNTVLAGHRDTVFRRLSELQRGDRVRLRTRQGTFDYRVSRTLRVAPRDVWVLDRDAAALTLITCYPFTWVGSAPERWIVQAEPDHHPGHEAAP